MLKFLIGLIIGIVGTALVYHKNTAKANIAVEKGMNGWKRAAEKLKQ